MCGRYTLFTPEQEAEIRAIIEEVNSRYPAKQGFAALTRQTKQSRALYNIKEGDIYPADVAPVLVGKSKNRLEARAMVWGYPKYKGSGVFFNTRIETADEKSMWKDSFKHRRCIVPAVGFYEWQHEDEDSLDMQMSFLPEENKQVIKKKKKVSTKYLFTLPQSNLMYMAGIYKEFKGNDGMPIEHFSIVTTSANPYVEKTHDRMPVILSDKEIDLWLSNSPVSLRNRNDIILTKRQSA